MSEYAVQDQALEVEDDITNDTLGDGAKTRGANWIDPEQEP